MVNTGWVHDLKVVELKEECKKRGLAVSGKKADLVERLEQHVHEHEKTPTANEPGAGTEGGATDPAIDEGPDEDKDDEEAAPGHTNDAAPASAEKPAVAEDEEPVGQPESASAAQPAEPADAPPEQPAAAVEEDAPSHAAAATEPAAAAQEEQGEAAATPVVPPSGPAAAADVDLDYGEESEGEGAAGAQQAHKQQDAEARSKSDEGGKRKREDGAGSAQRPANGERAAAASADRPTKVPRSSSGFSVGGNTEKGEAPAPEDVPEAAEPATRALRIDGFVRPFTERQVRELLSETGQVVALWMPSIKTHAYAVFETKAQAEATRRATYQLQWPATNPKRLAPHFVPLAEAETAIGSGAGNPDFRVRRTDEDGEEEAQPAAAPADSPQPERVPDRSQREWNKNRRSPSPPLEGVRDLREMLSRRASGRGSDAAAAAAAVVPAGRSPREQPDLPPGIGRTERRSERDLDKRLSGRGAAPPEERVLTLDELFRKTASKPCIYWLPLTDEQVAQKKQKAVEADETAAAGPAARVPAANGAQAAT